MGLTFTKLFARLFSKKEMRILMVRHVSCPRDAPKPTVLSRAETVRRSGVNIGAGLAVASACRVRAQGRSRSGTICREGVATPAAAGHRLVSSDEIPQATGQTRAARSCAAFQLAYALLVNAKALCAVPPAVLFRSFEFTQHRNDGSHRIGRTCLAGA